jgi:hypothetical protein
MEGAVAVSEPPAVDVSQAAELTGLSSDAIQARIRRGELAADERNGRQTIPLAELRRHDLLVEGGRYKSVRERAESLEAQLRTAVESRQRIEQQLADAQEKAQTMWGIARMAQQRDSRLEVARKRRSRLPWRRRRQLGRG